MEVTTALGIISFALVALLGVFPLGLENSRASVNETRAAQLSKMIYSTLATELSSAPVQVRCFSDSLTPLTLEPDGKVFNDGDTIPDVTAVLYASYDAAEQPKLTRATTAPPGAIYTLDLRFRPSTFSFSETTSGNPTPKSKKRVIGYDVRVAFRGLRKDKVNEKPFFETTSFVPSFQRAAYAK